MDCEYFYSYDAILMKCRPPPTAAGFYNWIVDEGANERNGNMMRNVKYAVFGLGNSLYSKHYCTAPRQLDFV